MAPDYDPGTTGVNLIFDRLPSLSNVASATAHHLSLLPLARNPPLMTGQHDSPPSGIYLPGVPVYEWSSLYIASSRLILRGFQQ